MVAREVHPPTYTPTDPALERDGIIYEYGSAANPTVSPVPYLALGSSHHEEGKLLRAAVDVSVFGRGGRRRTMTGRRRPDGSGAASRHER